MILRDYQQKAIDEIKNFFKKGGLHLILQAATGSGKTVIFTFLAKLVSKKHKKILILTDRAELLQQAGGSLRKIGLNSMYIQAGQQIVSNNFNCYVAMSQTLRRRIDLKYWVNFLQSIDLLIIDECHKQEFNYIFESELFDKKHVIGFTATPKRGGKQRQLGLDYETIIEGISIKELINKEFLINDDYFGIDAPDLSDVEFDYKKGDFKDSSLFKKFDSPKSYAGAVKNYKELTPNTKSICFCVNIEHCIKTAKEFNNAGISSKFVISNVSQPKQPEDLLNLGKVARYEERKRVYDLLQENKHLTGNRNEIFQDFKNNKFQILINAGIATTGYDEPSIETVIILRATLSTVLWLQMLGRGSRVFKGKTHFNILDFGGNSERLGHYAEDRLWSLWHETFKGEGLPPIKECGIESDGKPIISNKIGCKRPILASYKICPFCGFKYPKKEVEEINLSMIMLDSQSKKAVKTKRIKDMSNIELQKYWKIKGHKSAWLWRQLWYRGGVKSIENFGKEFGWKPATIQKAISYME